MNRHDLKYVDGLADDDLIRYLQQRVNEDPDSPLCGTNMAMLYNVFSYGRKHKQVTKDSFAYFLFDIIPDFGFPEACAFISDDLLTTDAQEIKAKFWAEQEAAEHAQQVEIIQDYHKKQQAKRDARKTPEGD